MSLNNKTNTEEDEDQDKEESCSWYEFLDKTANKYPGKNWSQNKESAWCKSPSFIYPSCSYLSVFAICKRHGLVRAY